MLVKEVMDKKVLALDSQKNVFTASKLMSQQDVSSVIVTLDDLPLGIVTERDIVRKIVAEGFDSQKVLLENIMTTPVITIGPDAQVEEACKLMSVYNIRRIPVVDDSGIIGQVTSTGIATMLAKEKDYSDVRLNALVEMPKDKLPPSYG